MKAVADDYAASWRRNFAPRIHAASFFAQLATRPSGIKLVAGLLKQAPAILTFGAYLSGKTQALRA